jgi:hypothetical protein
MRAHFGGTTPTQTQALATAKLDSFMEYRNQIAHRGASYATLGSSVIVDFVTFFKCLVGALSSILLDYLATFPPPP